MKINKIVYSTLDEVANMPQFDMKEMPRRAKKFLYPVAWLLAFPETIKHRVKVYKTGVKGLKPPYVLLCNHNSFFDFKVATKAIFPRMANNIVAIDGFINRENLLRNVGCVLKRKFIADPPLIRRIQHGLFKNKMISAIYPEARYSLTGTNAILPESLGKMAKMLKVPVVTLITHGNHLHQPVWNLKKRKLKTTANMTYILSVSDLETKSVDEINQIIDQHFKYDDYAYQKENNIHIKESFRAEGLHKILYQCPHCLKEGDMTSIGHHLRCTNCQQTYSMDTLGQLSASYQGFKLQHIPDWYEWQRDQVKQQLINDTYQMETDVYVDALVNSTGFYRLGVAKVVHNQAGFKISANWNGQIFNFEKVPQENYSIHLEFNYFGRGDGFSLSTAKDTYYFFPVNQDISVTKLHFAVEELYKLKTLEK